MDIIAVGIIAVGLAMDCFAVSLGIGASGVKQNIRSIFRVSFHFGLFQGGMAFLGWLAGNTLVNLISNFDHWIAFILLAWVGIRMIREGQNSELSDCQSDRSRGGTLMVLCVATSLDALAIGLTLAITNTPITSASLIIWLVSSILSVVGILIGSGLGIRFGKRMEIAGGILLILIGFRILFTHLQFFA